MKNPTILFVNSFLSIKGNEYLLSIYYILDSCRCHHVIFVIIFLKGAIILASLEAGIKGLKEITKLRGARPRLKSIG